MSQKWEPGVFTSVDAGFGVKLEVANELGVPSAHLHAPHANTRSGTDFDALKKRFDELGIRITVVFAGFDGESYADIPTVKETVGLVPAATRDARVVELKSIVDYTKGIGCDTTGLHIGFVPHDQGDDDYKAILAITQDICDYAAERDIHIHLETGQEPADILLRFLDDVDRKNLWVNFDPANMILYGCGEPIPALQLIGSRVRSVHCKDAKWSAQPGETWGEETALGKGDVDFEAFFRTLKEIGYTGPLTIERELSDEPERQKTEIAGALELIQEMTTKVLG